MKTVETTGKTIEEARELAAAELGVPIDRIAFEVLDEGKGFLGISRGNVRVRATELEEGAPAQIEAVVREPEAGRDSDRPDRREPEEGVEEWVMSLLRDILAAANLEGAPKLKSTTPDEITIELEGPDVAILIGKHGQTLDALQYLVGVALNKVSTSRPRITLDAESYRDRHAQMLTAKALEYAEAVKQHNEEAVLDPQPARDRRIMHMALADDPDIYTYSEGDGDYRHVVISPRK